MLKKVQGRYIILFVGITILFSIITADLIEVFAPIEFQDISINRHSIYVHFGEEWNSYPQNLLFEITTIWKKQNSVLDVDSEYTEFDMKNTDLYGINQLDKIHGKSFVKLIHGNNQCVYNWKPIHYRQTFDTIKQNIEYATGSQMSSDPYKIEFPDVKNFAYNDLEQNLIIQDGFAYFIPICTLKDTTSFDYSVKVDDESIGINVYFVPSIKEYNHYKNDEEFSFYTNQDCYVENVHSYTGTCNVVSKDSGLLIIVPDKTSRPVSKIMVNLNEN